MTQLDWARIEHKQAARSVRRLAQECRTRRYTWLDRRLDQERQRLEIAVKRLAELEADATQLGGAGTPPNSPLSSPTAKDQSHA
jgi:hypothetical protein